MSPKKNSFPKEKSNRIVLFADLRDSTDILLNFKKANQEERSGKSESEFSYEKFILDLHEMFYRELYLGHENTYAEIYGDGVMGVFPEDNSKYILENIYRLSSKMRFYNESLGVGMSRPKIDIGFGVTVGEVNFVYYPFDERDHPVGHIIHEAARIERVSKLYDARILVSNRFLNFAESVVNSEARFSYRFIDRVILKNFREPISLYEILVDNDPRFDDKKSSILMYAEAYSKYCDKKWKEAKEIFFRIYQEYGLGIGSVMAKRCDLLTGSPPSADWDGIWRLSDK